MNNSIRKTHPLIKIINNSLIDLPAPSSISLWWNFGSLLGMFMGMQIITGIFLAMHYTNNVEEAFNSVAHICRDVNNGWILRSMHSNGASLIFICMYLHIGRGIYYESYKLIMTWMIGIMLMMTLMGTAFLGYVLPWGQMSLWGATVITNLLSAVPYVGTTMVMWLWGGFSVDNATLSRFFTLHFLLPFIIMAMIIIHLLFLHQSGSNNPLGLSLNKDKIPFHPFFSIKDTMGSMIFIMAFMLIVLLEPRYLGDPENFVPANPLVTPVHIQPEWYFLFAYAILRSIPNKLGGVIAMIMAILIIGVIPFINKPKMQGNSKYPTSKLLFWFFTMNIILLTWIGARPAEEPFILTGQILTITYFSTLFISSSLNYKWDNLMN